MDAYEPARPKVLYVIGTQRGGTTIGGRLIGRLPGFEFVGELRKLWQVGLPEGRRCGCGLEYAECPVWSAVLPKAVGDTPVAVMQHWQDAAAPDRRSSWRAWQLGRTAGDADVASYSALLGSTYRALHEATGARVLVDTSKLPADAVLVSRLPDVDAYFLELVRDPRGTVHSAIRRSDDARGLHARQAVTGAAGWVARHLAAGALLRRVGPHRSMAVTYERLVAEPQTVLDEIAALVGEPAAGRDLVVNGQAELGVAHTPIGGGRFGPVSVDLRRDDRWITAMGGADRRLVSSLTWPLARRFDYFGDTARSR
jgi:hypothetical protein